MGNFSRDPDSRAADAAAKLYVAVRMQQGVPILDADWNLLDDLRRRDTETLGGRFLGDGVPTGSDGLRIFSVGQVDDFGIRGGLIIVNGKLLQIDVDFRYTTQPNFNNPAVTPPVGPLTLPAQSVPFVIYLDTWEREVDSQADASLVDQRIGIETAIRLKRDWAVRVARLTDFSGIVAATPPGHFFYALAQLNWIGGSATITDDMLAERRDTDASPRREIAYRRGQSALVLVDTSGFLETLVTLRDNVSDFLQYLTTKFVDPSVQYTAAEVMGVETLRAMATLADHGIALINARALDTRGALAFFGQLFEAEQRFLTVWKSFVLPLVTSRGTIYDAQFKSMVQTVETFLTGPAPVGFLTIADALQRGNLLEAQRSQDQINLQLAGEITKPTGFLLLTYLGSPAATIARNVPFDLRYRLSGSVTPDDTIQVDRFVDPEWKTELRNADGSTPFNLKFGPGADTREFLVTVTPSNAAPLQASLSLLASATHNRALNHISGQIVMNIGSAPPPSGDAFALTIATTNMSQAGGEFQIPVNSVGNMTFRLRNNTNTAAQIVLDFAPKTQTGWTIAPPLGVDLSNQTIPAQSDKDYLFQFQAPGTPGQKLVFTITVNDNQAKLLAQTQVTLTTV